MATLVQALDRLLRESPPIDPGGGTGGVYRAVGGGERRLILLRGVVGAADAHAALGYALEADVRTCFVTYPSSGGLDDLIAWLEAVRSREGGGPVSLYGGSFGGLVAQAWLARTPKAIADVVLAGTGPPDPVRSAKNARVVPRLARLPMPVWRMLLRLIVRGATSRAQDRRRWRAYYAAAIGQLTWPEIASRYRISIELDAAGPPDEAARACWRGRMLLLAGERDRIARGEVREQLRRTYPDARFHAVSGAGHGLSLEQPDEWLRVVSEFFRAGVR